MRKRLDDQRKMTLLKKLNFYEYLIAYGGPANSFLSDIPIRKDKVSKYTTILPQIKHSDPQ